jgi:hypothetical protein
MGVFVGVDVEAFRPWQNAAIPISAKATHISTFKTSIPMQAGDSLRVSNACEMVQIFPRLSRFFRWAWPPASENGAATTMDENKPLAGRFCNGKQVVDKILFAHRRICAFIAV